MEAQTTYYPYVKSKNNDCTIETVQLTKNETIVRIKVPRLRQWGGWVRFSSATVLVPSDAWSIDNARRSKLDYPDFVPSSGLEQIYIDAIKRIKDGKQMLSDKGYLIRSLGADQLDTKYEVNEKGRDFYYFEMHFDRLPLGCEDVYIREVCDGGWEWAGIKINNPFPIIPNLGLSEASIKQQIDKNNDGIVGIYESFDKDGYKLGCIKDGDTYKLVYLNYDESRSWWHVGDLKATLRPSATPGFYKADWYMANKTINNNVCIVFEGGSMKTIIAGDEDVYLKMYPISLSSSTSADIQIWSGTGFALNNGYIATNYHVIENAKSIKVQGIKGIFSTEYNAVVVGSDKYNDLALLQIKDSNFNDFGTIPYKIKATTSEVGEDIFVLGYPLTTTMGEEIKLTTGVISSKTGFQGDVSLYQISAPVQSGDSGGPLFDNNGNLIGVVNAKLQGAENVGYAIKTAYLKNLIESVTTASIIPTKNTLSTKTLPEKVKTVDDFIFLISCSNQQQPIYNQNGNSNSYITNNRDVVVTNPVVSNSSAEMAKISKVIICDNYTIIEIETSNITSNGYFQWCNINKNTYIKANGQKYTMIKTENIEIAPNKTYFQYAGQSIIFKLYFPKIPKTTQSFDLIESAESEWKWYGIKL